MRKAILASAVGLMMGAGLMVTQGAQAGTPYDGNTCNYATTQDVTTGPGPVVVYADTWADGDEGGYIGNPSNRGPLVAAGVCLETIPDVGGGALEAGATAPTPPVGTLPAGNANGPNRLCLPGVGGPGTNVNVPNLGIGAYVIADGHNTSPISQSAGYIGLSNYETSQGAGNNQGSPELLNPNDPTNPNGGGSSNSGGCAGVSTDPVTGSPVGIYAPVPLVACGNDTGKTWWNTSPGSGPSRDACFID